MGGIKAGSLLSEHHKARISEGLKSHYALHPHPGKSRTEIDKMVRTRKARGNYAWTPAAKQKLSKALKGRKFTEKHRQNISVASRGKSKSAEACLAMSERPLHKAAIAKQCEELKSQGFRVIPLDGEIKVIPDIIAVKDNKILAVEVERGKPKYDKYQDIHCYDDIIWILVGKETDHAKM